MNLIAKIIELFLLTRFIISPTLIGLILGFVIWGYLGGDRTAFIVGISIALIGFIIGVRWAVRVWKRGRPSDYLGATMRNPELDSDELIKKFSEEPLIDLLKRAEKQLSQYSGGYSGEYLDAKDFHKDLVEAIKRYEEGDESQLKRFWGWFAPTTCWDDFVGGEGLGLGNEIFERIDKMIER